jgi:L-alanine-DL-glutamate epimerase-like enolase superfamily enzyme
LKITGIDVFPVDSGFNPPRIWLFCAVRTDEGITGYSEFGNSGVTNGMIGLVKDLAGPLIGKDPTAAEKLYVDMYRRHRAEPHGATGMAIAGVELALWDIAGKAAGVPVHRLMGGPHRTEQRVYWSHLATYRPNNSKLLGVKAPRTLKDLAESAAECPAAGYNAFKTNIIWPGNPGRVISQGTTGPHDQIASRDIRKQARDQVKAMREAVGPDVDILLDINVNFKPSEAELLARDLEEFNLFWLEIDNQSPQALRQLRDRTTIPICSGEQLQSVRQYKPFFDAMAIHSVKVDTQWQGFNVAKKVADLAETYELNIAPHNYNGHLSSFQSVNLCASVSNVRIMESDPEQTPFRDDLFTVVPEVKNSMMKVPAGPGWGTDLNEKMARKYAWKG